MLYTFNLFDSASDYTSTRTGLDTWDLNVAGTMAIAAEEKARRVSLFLVFTGLESILTETQT